MRKSSRSKVSGSRLPLDRLQSNVRRAWRDFVRQAKSVLVGVGLAWVVWQVAKLLAVGF